MKLPNPTSILLSALVGLGGITLQILHEDAQSLIVTVKEMGTRQADDHTQIGIAATKIEGLQMSDSQQWDRLNDLSAHHDR